MIADCPGDCLGASLPAGRLAQRITERRPGIAPGPRQGEADQVALLQGQPPPRLLFSSGPSSCPGAPGALLFSAAPWTPFLRPRPPLPPEQPGPQRPGLLRDLSRVPRLPGQRGGPQVELLPILLCLPLRHPRLRRLRGPLERRGGGNGLPRRSPLLRHCEAPPRRDRGRWRRSRGLPPCLSRRSRPSPRICNRICQRVWHHGWRRHVRLSSRLGRFAFHRPCRRPCRRRL